MKELYNEKSSAVQLLIRSLNAWLSDEGNVGLADPTTAYCTIQHHSGIHR